MKKVLIIDWAIGRSETIRRLLEVYKASDTFIATDEWEAKNHLLHNKIDVILLDPDLTPLALEEEPEITPDLGGIGLILLNNLKEGVLKTYPKQPKIILFTVLSEDDLKRVGFPPEIPFLVKPASIEEILTEITKK